jgi:hypothetical protein
MQNPRAMGEVRGESCTVTKLSWWKPAINNSRGSRTMDVCCGYGGAEVEELGVLKVRQLQARGRSQHNGHQEPGAGNVRARAVTSTVESVLDLFPGVYEQCQAPGGPGRPDMPQSHSGTPAPWHARPPPGGGEGVRGGGGVGWWWWGWGGGAATGAPGRLPGSE